MSCDDKRRELNAAMSTQNIKGKDYVPVNQRILAFWELCPNGAITTEWLVFEPDWCACKARIIVDGVTVAEGTAFETRNASVVNRTSYIENCETSAIGRALGFFGLGTDGSIASAEEISAAIEQQREHAAPFDSDAAYAEYARMLDAVAEKTGSDKAEMLKKHEAFFKRPVVEWGRNEYGAILPRMAAIVKEEKIESE